MIENSQLKLLFETSLFIRANNPFAVPINLNMDNIKKHQSWTLKPIEDKVFVHMQYSWVHCSYAAGIQSKSDYCQKNRFGNRPSVKDVFYCAFKTEGLFQNPVCCVECKCDAGLFD